MPCPIGNMHQINGIPLMKSFTHLNIMQLTRPQLEMKFLLRHQNSQQYKNRTQHKSIILKFTRNQNILGYLQQNHFWMPKWQKQYSLPAIFCSHFFYWATVGITYFSFETCCLFGDFQIQFIFLVVSKLSGISCDTYYIEGWLHIYIYICQHNVPWFLSHRNRSIHFSVLKE